MNLPSFHLAATNNLPIAVEEAQRRVLATVLPVDPVRVSLEEALDRILAEDLTAPDDVPGGDNSAMDGYAVRAADLGSATRSEPVKLSVVEDIPAGMISETVLQPGTAMRIMTGASIPNGADAVVPVEDTDGASDVVRIHLAPSAGANVRRRGEDMKAGEIVLPGGTSIGPAEIGVLASLRRKDVLVGGSPRVAVLSTGNEVVDLDQDLGEGQVINSNAYALEAFVRRAGGIPKREGIVRDSLDETVAAIERALENDVVITTGGVSVGAYDWIRQAVERLGGEVRFWRVAMKPGKPVLFATLKNRLFFGLPGNPVSCLVTFVLFVAPAIRRMQGASDVDSLPPIVNAKVDGELRSPAKRREYQRVRVVSRDGALVAIRRPKQGSGVLTSMIGSNGLAVVEEGVSFVPRGAGLPVVLYGPVAAG